MVFVSKKVAIVVRDAEYDKILTPLAFAWLAASSDAEVDLLFVNWAARAVLKGEAEKLTVSAEHAEQEAWLKAQVAKAGLPTSVADIIRAIKATGRARIYVCSLAAHVFDVKEEDLLPEVDGIMGATAFLLEKAAQADVNMEF